MFKDTISANEDEIIFRILNFHFFNLYHDLRIQAVIPEKVREKPISDCGKAFLKSAEENNKSRRDPYDSTFR